MSKWILVLLLVVAAVVQCGACSADALQIATTAPTKIKKNQPATVSVTMKNALSPREPIVVTATATWEDEYGVAQSSSDSCTVTVIQPIKVNRYAVIVPALFDFVVGSGTVDGAAVTPTLDSNQLTFELDRTLLENEQLTITYSIKSQ